MGNSSGIWKGSFTTQGMGDSLHVMSMQFACVYVSLRVSMYWNSRFPRNIVGSFTDLETFQKSDPFCS